MKKYFLLILGLILSLTLFATEKFNTLNVEVPCNIKIFKAEDYSVRVLDKNGKISKDVTWEIKDSVLEIKGEAFSEKDNVVVIFSPVEQKILVDKENFTVKED